MEKARIQGNFDDGFGSSIIRLNISSRNFNGILRIIEGMMEKVANLCELDLRIKMEVSWSFRAFWSMALL